MGLCGGFSAEVRAKKMRQDGSAEFISTSLTFLVAWQSDLLYNGADHFFAWRCGDAERCVGAVA